jgi:hypothetical protein
LIAKTLEQEKKVIAFELQNAASQKQAEALGMSAAFDEPSTHLHN